MKRTVSQVLRPTLAVFLVGLAMAAGRAQLNSGPAVELALTPRGVEDDTLERGEPLPVAVRLTSPADPARPVELSPPSGTWVDLIRVELVDSGTG